MNDQGMNIDTAAEEISGIMQREDHPQASQPEPERAVIIDPVLLDEATTLNEGADKISEINSAAGEQKKAAAKKKFFDGIAGDQASETPVPAPAKIKTPKTANEFDTAQREIDVQVSQLQATSQKINWEALAKSDPDRWRLEKAEAERQHTALQGYQQQLNEARSLHQQSQQSSAAAQHQSALNQRDAQLASVYPELGEPVGAEKFITYLKDTTYMNDDEIQQAYNTWGFEKISKAYRAYTKHSTAQVRQQQVGKKIRVKGLKPRQSSSDQRVKQKMKAQNIHGRPAGQGHSVEVATLKISEMLRNTM